MAERREQKSTKDKDSSNETQIPDETSEVLDITTLKEYQNMMAELEKVKFEANENLTLAKNFKRDMERMKERNREIESELAEKVETAVGKKLLAVMDNFKTALMHIEDEANRKGMQMIFESLEKVLLSIGIERIETKKGEEFDEDRMSALLTEPAKTDADENKVANILTEGYIHKTSGRVVRYAQVSIYKK